MVAFYPHFVSCSENANLRDVVGLYCVDFFPFCFFLCCCATTMYLLRFYISSAVQKGTLSTVFLFHIFCSCCCCLLAACLLATTEKLYKEQLPFRCFVLFIFSLFSQTLLLLWSVNNSAVAFSTLWLAFKV